MIAYVDLCAALDRWNRRRQGLPEPPPAPAPRVMIAATTVVTDDDAIEEVSAAGGLVIESTHAGSIHEEPTGEIDLRDIVDEG